MNDWLRCRRMTATCQAWNCDKPSRPGRPYCSRRCYAISQRRQAPAKTPIATFVFAQMKARDITQSDFARLVGVAPATVSGWLYAGKGLRRKTYDRLVDCFGDDLPEAIQPDDDELRQHGRQLQASFGDLGRSAKARKASATSLRGRKTGRNPALAAAAREREERLRMEGGAPTIDRLGLDTNEGRLLWYLGVRLRENSTPTGEELQQWAVEAAGKYGYKRVETVRSVWKPKLVEKGLLSPGGRRPDEERHAQLETLLGTWERTASGQLCPGFWPMAAEKLLGDRRKAQQLTVWWRRHIRVCREVS